MGNNFHTPWVDETTQFTAASMNTLPAELDKGITYAKNVIVHCDGEISYVGGTLTWGATIRILFNTAAGNAVQNTIATGSISLSDNEFCYVDLDETNDTALTMAKASVTTGAASNFVTVARLVLGYRNTTNDEFYPVALKRKMEECLPAGEQALTCADVVTIDWLKGATARMTFDRASVAFTLSNGVDGKVYRLLLIQDATGERVATWTTTIKWAGKAAPTLTEDGNAEDIITFVQINGDWYASASLDFAVPV